LIATGNPQMLDIGAVKAFQFFAQCFGGDVKVLGTNQVADATALVSFTDARPDLIQFVVDVRRLIDEHRRLRHQVKQGAIRAGNRSIKLPARKYCHSAGANRLLDNLLGPANALSREAGVNRA
jgi:hypothetical protein